MMRLETWVSRVLDALIIALSIFAGAMIFSVYGGEATLSEKIAYTFIFAVCIWLIIYPFKWTIIWLIEALRK